MKKQKETIRLVEVKVADYKPVLFFWALLWAGLTVFALCRMMPKASETASEVTLRSINIRAGTNDYWAFPDMVLRGPK